ncbi:MAG: methylmalonyl Co-A mutase-associated GTPase MeaB [Planctomycetes bacterium]|nr:methylmalonyl Co-A mutase-associated GTPase MeaB [Planctomycetota bacterium]
MVKTVEPPAADVWSGDRRAIARAITGLENAAPWAARLAAAASARAGRAHRIGVTGPPGVGKSSLVTELTVALRRAGRTVGIVAVDPSSPFTGGALLGDRVRMQRVGLDPGVYIRSMATRGHAGGVARATFEVADLLDAAGKDVVLVETVGVGQSEVEIARTVDTTLVVLSPESGDTVQAMKAGIMEIADLLVINKADRPGADRLEAELLSALELSPRRHASGLPPILKTSAARAEGIDALLAACDRHLAGLRAGPGLAERRRANLRARIVASVAARLAAALADPHALGAAVEAKALDVQSGALPLDAAVAAVLRAALAALAPPDPADAPM